MTQYCNDSMILVPQIHSCLTYICCIHIYMHMLHMYCLEQVLSAQGGERPRLEQRQQNAAQRYVGLWPSPVVSSCRKLNCPRGAGASGRCHKDCSCRGGERRLCAAGAVPVQRILHRCTDILQTNLHTCRFVAYVSGGAGRDAARVTLDEAARSLGRLCGRTPGVGLCGA